MERLIGKQAPYFSMEALSADGEHFVRVALPDYAGKWLVLLLDNNKKVEGFLFVITRNIIFNKARSRMREDMFKMTILRSIENEEPYNQEDQMVAEDLKEYIDRLIAVLPKRQREIFLMSREENMTYREIAARCGIGEKAVERHIHLTLKFLKKNLLLFILFSMLPE